MKKYYSKFNGIKKTGAKCVVIDCKKDLIVTDLIVSNGENICTSCLNIRNKRNENKINKNQN